MNPVKPDAEDGAHQPDEHEHQVPSPPDLGAAGEPMQRPSPLKNVAPAPLPDRPS